MKTIEQEIYEGLRGKHRKCVWHISENPKIYCGKPVKPFSDYCKFHTKMFLRSIRSNET